MPRLVITKGPEVGRDYAIGTECVVGRGTDADFVVLDGGISRRHCRIANAGGFYTIEDLGSRNGTWVNGERAQKAALRDGDVIRLGGVEMTFRQKAVGEPPKAAASAPATPPAAPAPPKYDIQPRRRRHHF
jgi:pSer/pThr/pTyr-binding forkhead associated (FHA) protein